ncbi:hypothetical protein V1J52_16855 [Streptomyces sp. TRM 70351]|uniref:hypothetical protein n=1 Tax=Streptomyces sp. TRM 70351 TaxID=3116552 RepID=UPI002E7B0686|nr:hypothetical protein [Streptomyces sp. TRM 70351]MEE1929832.1 hypothetical protein [Streptomyces sp. TRM 70351]
MNPRPRLKSITTTPDQPHPAPPAPLAPAVGAGTVVGRKAVRSLPDPHAGDGRYPVAWLHITAPYGTSPTAISWCLCGRHERAAGPARVLALSEDHADHRDVCPLRVNTEGGVAA